MAQVSNTPTRTGARRRSQRVLMQVPVRIRGKNAQAADFEEFTETLAINAHGAMILLTARLTSGAVVHMRHNKTEEEQECHVAFLVRYAAAGQRSVWSLRHRAQPSGVWPFLPKTGTRGVPKPERFPASAPISNSFQALPTASPRSVNSATALRAYKIPAGDTFFAII